MTEPSVTCASKHTAETLRVWHGRSPEPLPVCGALPYLIVSQSVESLPVVVDLRRDIFILQNYPGHPTLAPLCKNKIGNRVLSGLKKGQKCWGFFCFSLGTPTLPPIDLGSLAQYMKPSITSLGVKMDFDLKPDSKIKIELFPIEASSQNKAGSSEAAL